MRRALDAFSEALARVLLRLFFREVEIVGREHVPRGRPLVLVANHENNLIDAILIIGFSGARPRFLAKSTLWSHPVVRPLLELSGALPVYRRQDDHTRVARNADTFARCADLLASGGNIALFPEGQSHNSPHRLPLKSGAARIILEAAARRGVRGIAVVPVGVTYEDKDLFRSRVLLQFGPPLDPAPQAAAYAAGPRRAVRDLTARMADALGEVTLNHGTWDEARLVARAAALLADEPEDARSLESSWRLRKWVWDRYQRLRSADPERADSLARQVERYDRAASAVARHRRPRRPWSWLRHGPLLPLFPVGTLLNGIPYRLPGWLAQWLTRDPGEPATYKLVSGMVLFPAFWALEATLALRWAGLPWAALTLLLAPASGYAALLVKEAAQDWWAQRRRGEPRGSSGEEWTRLLAEHARLRREIAAAAREWSQGEEVANRAR